MYISPYFVPFSCQMVVMNGLTYHMMGHCNKLHYSVIFSHISHQKCIHYINVQCLLLPSPKTIFKNTKFAIFGDKYLSQDLIVILPNITQLCQVRQRGVGALPRQSADVHEHPPSYHEALTQCCADVEDGGPALEQHCVNALCLLGCGHSWSANSSRWHNVTLMVAHRLQHWADISPALAYQYIGLNTINVCPMLA